MVRRFVAIARSGGNSFVLKCCCEVLKPLTILKYWMSFDFGDSRWRFLLTPFILIGRRNLPPESAPEPQQVYDSDLQIWLDKTENLPLVECVRTRAQPTQFGETTFTETREGTDRPEGASVEASDFGETVHTRTREGLDQTEGSALQGSQVGETTLTKTSEGADQPEVSTRLELDASYSHF
jgi:hypothetical protein